MRCGEGRRSGRLPPPRPFSEGSDPITRRNRLALALISVQVISSGTHLVAKGALLLSSPLTVALLRFMTASVALLLFQRFWGSRQPIERRDWPTFLLLGLLVVPLNQGCFLFGLSSSTPSHASLLYALTPLVVLLFAGRLLREHGLIAKAIGVLVAFLGVGVILFERGLRQELTVLGGDLVILVAVFAWALYTVLSKRLLVRYDAMTVTTWAIVCGTALSLPALLIPGAIQPFDTIRPEVWGALLYLSIGTNMIAYPLWSYALKNMDASKVAITANTQPILTGAMSWLLFREEFTPGFIAGAVLILAGVTWVETRR